MTFDTQEFLEKLKKEKVNSADQALYTMLKNIIQANDGQMIPKMLRIRLDEVAEKAQAIAKSLPKN